MNKKQLAAAIETFKPLHVEGKTKEEVVKAMVEDVYSESEAEEIYQAIVEDADAPLIGQQQNQKPPQMAHSPGPKAGEKIHPNYKWFNEFHARIQKREVYNALAGKSETIITGWQLEKIMKSTKIEPSIAKGFNSFANGFDVNGPGLMYFEKEGTHAKKTGDIVSYEEWALSQGYNLKQDINHLLKDA